MGRARRQGRNSGLGMSNASLHHNQLSRNMSNGDAGQDRAGQGRAGQGGAGRGKIICLHNSTAKGQKLPASSSNSDMGVTVSSSVWGFCCRCSCSSPCPDVPSMVEAMPIATSMSTAPKTKGAPATGLHLQSDNQCALLQACTYHQTVITQQPHAYSFKSKIIMRKHLRSYNRHAHPQASVSNETITKRSF